MLLGIIIGAVGMALFDLVFGKIWLYIRAKRLRKKGIPCKVDYRHNRIFYLNV